METKRSEIFKGLVIGILLWVICIIVFFAITAGFKFSLGGTSEQFFYIFMPAITLVLSVVFAIKKRGWVVLGMVLSLPGFFLLAQILWMICFSFDPGCYL